MERDSKQNVRGELTNAMCLYTNKSEFGSYISYTDFFQEDPAEVLERIVHTVQNEIDDAQKSSSDNASFLANLNISNLFSTTAVTHYRCHECGSLSRNEQSHPFLQQYTSIDTMCGEKFKFYNELANNTATCANKRCNINQCNNGGNCKHDKYDVFDKRSMPECLIIIVTRWKLAVDNSDMDNFMQKDSRKVPLHEYIKYITNPASNDYTEYHLSSVIMHHGTRPKTGHITIRVKNDNQWIEFDDEEQTLVNSKRECSTAYVLLYQKAADDKRVFTDTTNAENRTEIFSCLGDKYQNLRQNCELTDVSVNDFIEMLRKSEKCHESVAVVDSFAYTLLFESDGRNFDDTIVQLRENAIKYSGDQTFDYFGTQHKSVVISIHQPRHWICARIKADKRIVEVYDSYSPRDILDTEAKTSTRHILDAMTNSNQQENNPFTVHMNLAYWCIKSQMQTREASARSQNEAEWTFINNMCPQQNNKVDCGAYMLYNIEHLMTNPDYVLDTSSNQMRVVIEKINHYRCHIAEQIK